MSKRVSLLKNIILANFKALSFPYKLTFAMTYKCNLRCRICNIWESPVGKELNVGEIEAIFSNLNNLGWLDLTGGEISLRNDMLEIVKAIIQSANKLLFFHISTNGQVTDKIVSMTEKILEHDLIPIVSISIDGPEEINDKLRGSDGASKRALETFRSLKKLSRGYYYLSCTISDYNIDYLEDFLAELKKISFFSFSDLHFNIFHRSRHYYKNQYVNGISRLEFKNIKKYMFLNKKGNFIKKFFADRYAKGLKKYLNQNRYPVKCQALKSSCFIDPCGNVYPCAMYDRPIGNLRDNNYNLNNIWQGIGLTRVRNDIANKRCPGCWTPCEAYPAILGDLI